LHRLRRQAGAALALAQVAAILIGDQQDPCRMPDGRRLLPELVFYELAR
jgi:hypothetical protein